MNKQEFLNKFLEIAGTTLAIMGAVVLAFPWQHNLWGFPFFLLSNILLVALFIKTKQHWLLYMQTIFLLTSLMGVHTLWMYIEQTRNFFN